MTSLKSLMRTNAGWGMTVLRIPIGAIFIGHGLPKFGYLGGGGLEGTAGFLASLGLPMPMLMAWLVALSETVGGAFLIIGFLTRLSAFTLVISMLVAIFMVHWSNGFLGQGGYQWALALCAASAALMLDGAGPASVDKAMSS